MMFEIALSVWAYGMIPAFVIFTAFEATDKYSDGGLLDITIRTVLWPVVIIGHLRALWGQR